MAENQQVPRFAHLNYEVLHQLDISINEYFLLDMIFHLSGNGSRYCNKKIENIAFDMKLSVSGIRKLRDRLIEKKLLKKGVGNRLTTSEKVYKVYFLEETDLKKSALSAPKSVLSVQKSVQKVIKTPVENNKRLTIERRDDNLKAHNPTVNGPGYAKAKQRYELLKRRVVGKVGV